MTTKTFKTGTLSKKKGKYYQKVTITNNGTTVISHIWGDTREEVIEKVKDFLASAGVEVKSDSGDGTVERENKI